MSTYAIGIDYGTESGRVVIVDTSGGREAGSSVVMYRHGVIDGRLPGSQAQLPADFALQHPSDYLEVVRQGIKEALKESGVSGEDIIGMGVDFTSCTMMPVDGSGTPLCLYQEMSGRHHAWPKLWKHHAAQDKADEINALAAERKESFLSRYGGKISSEWMFPKMLEVYDEDPQVYERAVYFVEATDWICWQLTKDLCRSSCTLGYKAIWHEKDGFVSGEFLNALRPGFAGVLKKLDGDVKRLGSRAGFLSAQLAGELGIPRVPVAVGNIDAHVSLPAVGVSEPGKMVMVMGTSICHLLVSPGEAMVPGITGVVSDGILPGFYGYEAGQAAVGDMFKWFVESIMPQKKGEKPAYSLLEKEAAQIYPGQSGLLALDWWNGNRSILGNADLSGVMLGFGLKTNVAEMYRALLEGVAFGTRIIVDNFVKHGVAVNELMACGGISQKSPLLMQIYADVMDLPVSVSSSLQAPALGAAIFGAVAAGAAQGGYDGIMDAVKSMSAGAAGKYLPDAQRAAIYRKLYGVYLDVHDFLGRGSSLKMLKEIKLGGQR